MSSVTPTAPLLASAYPSSALSAGQLTVMAVVVTGLLAAWLGAVYLAARPARPAARAPAADRAAAGAGTSGSMADRDKAELMLLPG